MRVCPNRQEERNSTASQRRRQTSHSLARVAKVVRAGRRQGDGVGGCSSGVICEMDIVGSEFSECRRAHTHSLVKYPLGKPQETKLLNERVLYYWLGCTATCSVAMLVILGNYVFVTVDGRGKDVVSDEICGGNYRKQKRRRGGRSVRLSDWVMNTIKSQQYFSLTWVTKMKSPS